MMRARHHPGKKETHLCRDSHLQAWDFRVDLGAMISPFVRTLVLDSSPIVPFQCHCGLMFSDLKAQMPWHWGFHVPGFAVSQRCTSRRIGHFKLPITKSCVDVFSWGGTSNKAWNGRDIQAWTLNTSVEGKFSKLMENPGTIWSFFPLLHYGIAISASSTPCI